jgi:hypothetical protein
MATNLKKLVSTRVNEDYLMDTRGYRLESMQDWKNRLTDLDDLYKGEYWHRYAGEFDTSEAQLAITNLIQVGLDDMGRLVSEAVPSVRCIPTSDTENAAQEANVREHIANTYWDVNNGESLVPRLAMDLAGAGAAFVTVHWADEEYPCFSRIDPRYCYPDVHNGQLQDLLVVRPMRLRQAARLFPALGLDTIPPEVADGCDIIEYYSMDECVQAVTTTKAGKAVLGGIDIIKRWKPNLKKPPVAFAQLDTYDGQFRGMFDQIATSLITKNRIIKQMLDYTDQMVFAPFESKGVLNPDDPPGPNTHYRLDPNVQDAHFGRVAPAGPAPQLFALLDYLDKEQRAGASYPVQRHGEVSQSIASAAFVNSTMGQLTTSVKNLQRLIAVMRQHLNAVAFEIDEKYLNFPKPMTKPIGRKHMYSPAKDIDGVYMNIVTYGAGAGMDRMTADVRVMQHKGNGIISAETAREQVDYIDDPKEEGDKLEREAASGALMQKFLTESTWQDIAQVIKKMNKGTSLADAAIKHLEEAQAKAAEFEAAQGPPEGMDMGGAPGEGGPPDAAAQQKSLQSGGIPGEAPQLTEPKFAPPPMTNVIVKAPGT